MVLRVGDSAVLSVGNSMILGVDISMPLVATNTKFEDSIVIQSIFFTYSLTHHTSLACQPIIQLSVLKSDSFYITYKLKQPTDATMT